MDRLATEAEIQKVREAGHHDALHDEGPDIEHWADIDEEGNNIFDAYLTNKVGIVEAGTLHPDATDYLWTEYVKAYREGKKNPPC